MKYQSNVSYSGILCCPQHLDVNAFVINIFDIITHVSDIWQCRLKVYQWGSRIKTATPYISCDNDNSFGTQIGQNMINDDKVMAHRINAPTGDWSLPSIDQGYVLEKRWWQRTIIVANNSIIKTSCKDNSRQSTVDTLDCERPATYYEKNISNLISK